MYTLQEQIKNSKTSINQKQSPMMQSARQSHVTINSLAKSARNGGHVKKHSNSGLNTWGIEEEEGEVIAQ